MIRPLLLRFFRALAGIYFRDIEVVGAPPPGTRGRLFAANHVNGLIDPILVVTNAPFPIAPVAKAPLFRVPVLRTVLRVAEAVPVVRRQDDNQGGPNANDQALNNANDAAFDRVAEHLARGGNLLIFPEGVSHNEPQLAPLKTGPARMLSRACDRGARGLTFQAVALEFDARDTFRSRALVVFGPVREVDALPSEDRVARITETIRDDLRDLLVEGETWPERRLIVQVATMLAHDAGDRSLEGSVAIGGRVAAARQLLGDGEHYQDVRDAVGRYYDLLERTGARDDQVVAKLPRAPGAVTRAVKLVALPPFAALGFVLFALPYQLPRIAQRLAGRERDVISTYKLVIGLVSYSIWAAALVTVAAVALSARAALLATVVIILAAFAALEWLDRSELLSARLAARRHLAALERARAEAMAAITRARAVVEPG